jgi:hypothetical protein
MVEHLTHNTKIVGSNPFTANGSCEMVKNNLHSRKNECVLKHFFVAILHSFLHSEWIVINVEYCKLVLK